MPRTGWQYLGGTFLIAGLASAIAQLATKLANLRCIAADDPGLKEK
jgi:hypothetical protein